MTPGFKKNVSCVNGDLSEPKLEEAVREVAGKAWEDLRLQVRRLIEDAGGVTNLPVDLARDLMIVLELLQGVSEMSPGDVESALRFIDAMRGHWDE
ncbi:MAG: hypothetical protein ACRDOO_20185 [Actinomadura sp.]